MMMFIDETLILVNLKLTVTFFNETLIFVNLNSNILCDLCKVFKELIVIFMFIL